MVLGKRWGPRSYATRSLIACKKLTKHGWERKLLRLRWRRSDPATHSTIFKYKSLQTPKESHCAEEKDGTYKPEKLQIVQKVIIFIYLYIHHRMWRTQGSLGKRSPRGTCGKVDKTWCLQLRLNSPGFCQGLTGEWGLRSIHKVWSTFTTCFPLVSLRIKNWANSLGFVHFTTCFPGSHWRMEIDAQFSRFRPLLPHTSVFFTFKFPKFLVERVTRFACAWS